MMLLFLSACIAGVCLLFFSLSYQPLPAGHTRHKVSLTVGGGLLFGPTMSLPMQSSTFKGDRGRSVSIWLKCSTTSLFKDFSRCPELSLRASSSSILLPPESHSNFWLILEVFLMFDILKTCIEHQKDFQHQSEIAMGFWGAVSMKRKLLITIQGSERNH